MYNHLNLRITVFITLEWAFYTYTRRGPAMLHCSVSTVAQNGQTKLAFCVVCEKRAIHLIAIHKLTPRCR